MSHERKAPVQVVYVNGLYSMLVEVLRWRLLLTASKPLKISAAPSLYKSIAGCLLAALCIL